LQYLVLCHFLEVILPSHLDLYKKEKADKC
jgi:hypothetical protein